MENMEEKDVFVAEEAPVDEIPAETPVEETPIVVAAPAVEAPVDDGKKLSIAALVLGILGIVGGYIPVVCYFTLVCSILGIVLGVKGRKLSVAAYGKASGLATAGLVLGIIGTAFAALGVLCVACAGALAAIGLAA